MNLILGDYYTALSKDVFIKRESKGKSAPTPELMDLINKRLGVYSESSENERLNDGMLKQITGNDTISARPLYGKQITFKPYIKPIMLTNHRPQFDSDDEAMWARLKYIPCLARFTNSPVDGEFKKDVEFINNLKTIYLDEFFTVIVGGAIKWFADKKLVEPDSIKEATNNYMAELDSSVSFINDRCEKDQDFRLEPKHLYDSYCEFISEEGGNRLQKPAFFKKIESLGYTKIKSAGIYYFKGLKLASQSNRNLLML
jgi:putative DNA primase/helicase